MGIETPFCEAVAETRRPASLDGLAGFVKRGGAEFSAFRWAVIRKCPAPASAAKSRTAIHFR